MDIKGFLSNLKMKAPQVDISGGRSVNQFAVNLPTSTPNITEIKNRASGSVDLNFEAPSMVEGQPTVFGMGGSGNFMEGQVKFPEELQVYGAPASQQFGQGLTVDQLRAYLGIPITENTSLNVKGQINPYYVDGVDGMPLGEEKNIGAEIQYRF